jgi:trans-aconitate methyltransferase
MDETGDVARGPSARPAELQAPAPENPRTSTSRTPNSPTSAREWDAATYHVVSNPHVVWGNRVLARLPLRGDESVIDAGCGTGRLTALLLERLPHGRVLALDASENMLRTAEAELRPRFGDRVSFRQVDLQTLEVDTPVDAIFSTATFHWIPDHDALVRRLFAALVPGGRLVAQCGGGPNIARLVARVATLMATPPFAASFAGWSGPWTFADAETTARRLRAAGFVEVETSLEPAPTILPDAETYRRYLASVVFGSHLARLPDESTRTAFIAALTDQAATDDPPFSLDYWRLNLAGRRP